MSVINVSINSSSSSSSSNIDQMMGRVYFYLTAITSTLSMFGAALIVLTYFAFRDLRTTGRLLLVCLSVADFLTAAGNFLGIVWYTQRNRMDETGSTFLCRFHASLTIFSSISSFLWTVSIATHLFVCISVRNLTMADKMILPYFLVCWIIPAVISSVAWGLNVIGHDRNLTRPSWCWIDPDTTVVNALFWQYTTGKAWEIACYVLTGVLYGLVKRSLHKQATKSKDYHSQSPTNGAAKRPNAAIIADANRKLIFVPVIFVVLRIWGTIRFIIGTHFHQELDGMLQTAMAFIVPLQGIGDSAQGFANCILFCVFTKRVRLRCSDALYDTCGCFRPLAEDQHHHHPESSLPDSQRVPVAVATPAVGFNDDHVDLCQETRDFELESKDS